MLSLTSSALRRGVITSVGRRHLQPAATILEARRTYYPKDYDKKILCLPDEVTYRHDDPAFDVVNKRPRYYDEPYIQRTDDEIVEIQRIKLEREISKEQHTEVDSSKAPFNEVFLGVDDGGRYTNVEPIPDLAARWHYVERLLPKKHLEAPIRADSVLLSPVPETKPDLPYFVSRTRSRVFPLYRENRVLDRDHKTYWRNRWDGLFNRWKDEFAQVGHNMFKIKWENNEKTITVTYVNRIQGDIWAFEADARKWIESAGVIPEGHRLLSGVNEVRGRVEFQGDHVGLLYKFLKEKGF